MDHTKYRDFTFSYIISRFHLENIDVPFLSINGSVVSSNGSVVYSSRTSYHAKGLVCNHKNCFAAIRFSSFFCNIRRIAPRFDWTLMERWRKTPAVDLTSMVARRTAALRLNIWCSAAGRRASANFDRWPCGERRASADLNRGLRRSRSPSALRFFGIFVEFSRALSNHPSRVLPKLSNPLSRLLSKFVERFSLFFHVKHVIMKSTGNYSFRRSTPVPTLRFSFLPSSFTLLMEFR